jgi:hypothetical protein
VRRNRRNTLHNGAMTGPGVAAGTEPPAASPIGGWPWRAIIEWYERHGIGMNAGGYSHGP